MYILGLKLLALFYCLAGGLFGELVRGIYLGRVGDWFSDRRGFLIGVAISNVIALSCLHFLRRSASIEAPLEKLDRPLNILIRRLPVSNRLGLLLLSVSWIIGFILGIVLSI